MVTYTCDFCGEVAEPLQADSPRQRIEVCSNGTKGHWLATYDICQSCFNALEIMLSQLKGRGNSVASSRGG